MATRSSELGAPIFRAPDSRIRELGLSILRLTVGVVFIAHGAQKFFMLGVPAVTEGFAQGGIPMPSFMAPFIASVEFLGGIALVVGLLTRLAALGTALTMLGAIFFVHLKGGFFLPAGFEYNLVLLSASVALLLMGPGTLSLDARIARGTARAATTSGRGAARRAA